MTERNKYLKRLQICDFTLEEVGLYLDTHPKDKTALEFYEKYLEIQKKIKKEYVSKFGPIQATDYDGSDYWKWVDSPWPWERQKED